MVVTDDVLSDVVVVFSDAAGVLSEVVEVLSDSAGVLSVTAADVDWSVDEDGVAVSEQPDITRAAAIVNINMYFFIITPHYLYV